MSQSVTDRQIRFLASKLAKMSDFKDNDDAARQYAQKILEKMRDVFGKGESFTDQLLCLTANVTNLDGEIKALNILPEDLAVMTETQLLSRQQKREQEALVLKRAREKTAYDKTSMLCDKCGLVRRDRININEIGLDSEENGTQFDYNFDNTCACPHSSDEEASDVDDEDARVVNPVEGTTPPSVTSAPVTKASRTEKRPPTPD